VAGVWDLTINLVASVLAAVAAWVLQRVLAYRRLARTRAFFGVRQGSPSLLTVGRHWSSPRTHSVHRNDVAAIVELGAVVKECGGRADVVPGAEAPRELGKMAEFCVGGPDSNPRTAAHLAALLPGVRVARYEDAGAEVPITVGEVAYGHDPDKVVHVLLARAVPTAHPVFLLVGQTSLANLAAARYLAAHHGELRRRYGSRQPFCLVLRVVKPKSYGPDLVELVADVTEAAFGPAPEQPPALPRRRAPLRRRATDTPA